MDGIGKYYNAVAGSGMFGTGLLGLFLSRRNNLSDYVAIVSLYITCAGLYYLTTSLTENEYKVSKSKKKAISKPSKKRFRLETPKSSRKVTRTIRTGDFNEERNKIIEAFDSEISREMRIRPKIDEEGMKIRQLLTEMRLPESLDEAGMKFIEKMNKEMSKEATEELDEEGKRIIENLNEVSTKRPEEFDEKKIVENLNGEASTKTQEFDEKKIVENLNGEASTKTQEFNEKKIVENLNGEASTKTQEFDEEKIVKNLNGEASTKSQELDGEKTANLSREMATEKSEERKTIIKNLNKEVSTEMRNRLELDEDRKKIIEDLDALQIDYTESKNAPVVIKLPNLDQIDANALNIPFDLLTLQKELRDIEEKDIVIETSPIKMQLIDIRKYSPDDPNQPLTLDDVIEISRMKEN